MSETLNRVVDGSAVGGALAEGAAAVSGAALLFFGFLWIITDALTPSR